MKKNNLQKGFTLIELLVVVAIIAILSTAVLASLNSARAKARDARISSQVSSLRAQMELYYSDNGLSYGGPNQSGASDCTINPFKGSTIANAPTKLIAALVIDSTNVECRAKPQNWVVAAKLSSGVVCADSSGVSKTNTTAASAADAIDTTTGLSCN